MLKHRLREIMDLYGDSMEDLAKYLDISYQTLSKKLNGHTDFTLTELKLIKDRYNLVVDDIEYIFFN